MFEVIDVHSHYVPPGIGALEIRGGTLAWMLPRRPMAGTDDPLTHVTAGYA